jgi:photosystem II stability/assembly factor-like uncharacterized protein
MRLPIVGLVVLLTCSALAQEGTRISKDDERARFHPAAKPATPWQDREAAFRQRRRMEAESPFGGLNWRNIGPEVQGGRVIDIDAPLDDPDSVHIAFATGGLWRTRNDGQSWDDLFVNQSAFGIGAIAVSKDGKTIYVGTGEANSQRTSYAGTGVFKSEDAGKSWRHVGLPASHHISRVVIDPLNPKRVFVAVMGALYSQNPERGLYRTDDGGGTWNQVLRVDEFTGCADVVVHPRNPNIVLAGMWDRDRRAWNFRESGRGSALYRSENGGDTWARIPNLPQGNDAGRIGLALCAGKPSVMYALYDNQAFDPDWDFLDEFEVSGVLTPRRFKRLDEARFGALDRKILEPFWTRYAPATRKLDAVLEDVKAKKLTMSGVRAMLEERSKGLFEPDLVHSEVYRSNDSGRTWRRTVRSRLGEIGGYYWGKIAVNPANADEVFSMGVPLLRSRDGGVTWQRVARAAHVDFHAVWHDPRRPEKVWLGTDGGPYISYDGGETVRNLNNLPVAQATTLALDNKRPYHVFIGLQDNGTMRGPSTYRPGRDDPNRWTTVLGGDGSAIAVDPRGDGDQVYVAFQFGQHYQWDSRTLQTRYVTPRPKAGEPEFRFNWISPFVISSHHPDIVYVGSQFVHRSFDQGKTWETLSPDLTKNRPNGDVPHSTIKELSESPFRFGVIYAGCDDGNLKMTPDGGVTWIDISTPEPDKWVSRVVASRWDPNTVYVAQTGYREDDWKPYLWRSSDRGKTWVSIASNLPLEHVNSVREDPTNKDILYVGTGMGVFVSFDAGGSWETLHGGFPALPVHDIAVHERDRELVAATHARGVYILDLKPVQSLTKAVREAPITVFPVADVRRTPRWGLRPRPIYSADLPDSPVARVSFFVKDPGDGAIRLLDKAGAMVKEVKVSTLRGFNDVELALELKPGKPFELRRSLPDDPLADPYADRRPEYPAPGDYQIEVEIGPAKARVPLKISS